MRASGCAALAVMLVAAATAASAEDAARPPTALDDLEFTIEIGQHALFIKRRDAEGSVLAPFSTDGCSGGQSAGWAFFAKTLPALAKRHGDLPPWEQCCVAHDRVYHSGGPPKADAKASFAARRAADEALRQCVIATGNDRIAALSALYNLSHDEVTLLYRTIANVMYRAVRLGGIPCSGLSWRWGYGWPQCF